MQDQLDAMQRELLSLRREVRGQRRRSWRKHLPVALVALLVALVPLAANGADVIFSDIDQAAEVHRANISAIAGAGITSGFADPDHLGFRTYNPKGLVTREEMASFLARTAGLGTNAPVANAQTAVSAQTAVNATNADKLGGQPASAYLLPTSPLLGQGRAAQGGIAQGTPNEFDGNYKPIAEVALTVPTRGYVMGISTTTLFTLSSSQVNIAITRDDIPDSDGGFAGEQFDSAQVFTRTAVFSVAAGTHLFIAQVRRISGGPISPGVGNSIVAIFIPSATAP